MAAKIGKMNAFIESVLQDRLGNQYDNIFEYAEEHEDYRANVDVLVLFDFPKAFDERTLAELRNILRNGSRCGIFTIISYSPSPDGLRSHEFEQNMQSVFDLTTVISQSKTDFVLRGLPLTYYVMPEKIDFDKFFSKYMLIFEGINNRGIAFAPLIKKLVDLQDIVELDSHISYICEMMENYEKAYAQVPAIGSPFAPVVILGTVLYPADIFSDSVGYQKIKDKFGSGNFTEDMVGYVELPLTFDLRNNFNLLLYCSQETNVKMLSFAHHVMWSFLSFMPVTKVDICVFDSEQRGNSIIPFLDFRKQCPDVFDQKIYTNQESMIERLQKINIRISISHSYWDRKRFSGTTCKQLMCQNVLKRQALLFNYITFLNIIGYKFIYSLIRHHVRHIYL